eukprot:SAG31_NODE_2937_length_4889_cov_3.571399_1_plen_71_part_00
MRSDTASRAPVLELAEWWRPGAGTNQEAGTGAPWPIPALHDCLMSVERFGFDCVMIGSAARARRARLADA